jgi:hypothetical protein
MRRAACFLIVIFFSLHAQLFGQEVFRIKGEFSIKTKNEDKGNLTMGTFYFDANSASLLYKVKFPEPEIWLFRQQQMHQITADTIISQDSAMGIVDFSLFSMVLKNQLSHYGLRDSPFKISEVKKEGELVITTWSPPQKIAELVGNVLVSTKNRRLFGVVFLDVEGNVLRKQFFRDYQKFGSILFPTEIVDLFFKENEIAIRQITNYSNIVINATDENDYYNFVVPAVQ